MLCVGTCPNDRIETYIELTLTFFYNVLNSNKLYFHVVQRVADYKCFRYYFCTNGTTNGEYFAHLKLWSSLIKKVLKVLPGFLSPRSVIWLSAALSLLIQSNVQVSLVVELFLKISSPFPDLSYFIIELTLTIREHLPSEIFAFQRDFLIWTLPVKVSRFDTQGKTLALNS